MMEINEKIDYDIAHLINKLIMVYTFERSVYWVWIIFVLHLKRIIKNKVVCNAGSYDFVEMTHIRFPLCCI